MTSRAHNRYGSNLSPSPNNQFSLNRGRGFMEREMRKLILVGLLVAAPYRVERLAAFRDIWGDATARDQEHQSTDRCK